MDLYFAYGSNLDEQRMIDRFVIYDKMIPAVLNDYELRFNKVSVKQGAVANVIHNNGHVVEGVLYEVANIEALDKYEGYPKHYDRVKMLVSGREAWVYVAQPQYIEEGLKPKQEYVNRLLAGRRYLSKSYYNELKNIKCIN